MYVYKTFNNPDEMVDFLNGAIVSSPLAARTYGLHGLTLIINNGVGDKTTTFADASGAGLTPTEILAQIRAVDATMAAVMLRMYGHMPQKPVLVINSDGYVLKSGGTANAVLGLPEAETTVTPTDSTKIVHVTASVSGGPRYDLLIDAT